MSASSRDHHLGPVAEDANEESIQDSDSETLSTAPRNERDDLVNPYWIEDSDVKKGEVEYLSSAEVLFWKDLLAKYLFPIDENKEEKVMLLCFYAEFALSNSENVNFIFQIKK